MKKNIKWTIFIAGLLVVSLATAGYAVSGFKGHMSRMSGKGFVKEHVLSKLDYTVQELKLTPAQQGKYSTIRDRMSSDLDSIIDTHSNTRDAMRAEIAKGDPNIRGMAQKMKQEIAAMSEAATTQIDYMMNVYDILDANQKKLLAAKLKDHMNDHCDFNDD